MNSWYFIAGLAVIMVALVGLLLFLKNQNPD